MFEEIKIPLDSFETTEGDSKLIKNLSRVNIFIGPNNSGKSKFLRELFVNRKVQFRSSYFDIKKFDTSLSQLIFEIKGHYKKYNIASAEVVDKILSNLALLDFESTNQPTKSRIEYLKSLIDQLAKLSALGSVQLSSGTFGQIDMDRFMLECRNSAIFFNQINKDTDITPVQRNYIPILRGLRPIQFSEDGKSFIQDVDSYLERTIFDYFSNRINDLNEFEYFKGTIYTGLNIYKELQNQLLNQRESRDNVKKFEDFLRINFFNNNEVALIPKIDSDVLLVGISTVERLIYELGDGIQSIIQLLYPIFINKHKKCVFFIEEPEINMHPGLQRIFLDTLLNDEFKNIQFFITTHSNHFLDMSFDKQGISIYKFAKNQSSENFIIENLLNEDSSVLNDLGVRNSSVFLSNCTIWVEGITDRKYLRRCMELYRLNYQNYNKYKEDLHYSFVEYAGSNITHWNFDEESDERAINALKLSNKVFLIADSDITTSSALPKNNRFLKFREILGDNFYITEGKEIENMLSPFVIQNVVADYEGVLISDAKLDFLKLKPSERISLNSNKYKIKKYSYWNMNIGDFIEDGLDKNKKRRGSYKDGNTLSDKGAFCDKAIKFLNSYDDLTEEAIQLCEKIYKFIEDSNK